MATVKGLQIRCLFKDNVQLRDLIIEFASWLRKNIEFKIPVKVYIRNEYIREKDKSKKFYGTFVSSDNKQEKPYITVDIKRHTDSFKDVVEFSGEVLMTIAHEVIHYIQWSEEEKLSEEEAEEIAEDKAEELVDRFIANRKYNLTITSKIKKILECADIQNSQEQYSKAIILYSQAIGEGCVDSGIYNTIGYCYDCIGEYNKSLIYYDKAILIEEDNDVLYFNKGYALYYLERYYEAIVNFNKALRIKPCKETYVFKAYAEIELENHREVIDCFNKAIDLDSNYDIAYNDKGQYLCTIGRYDEGKECLEKAISISDDYADAYYNLAILNVKSKNVDNAIMYLRKAIDCDHEFLEYAKEEIIFKEIINIL